MRHLVEEMTTFALVVKAGSFTHAAKQMGKSKTYVSLQVSRLEEALGLQLLFRTTRRLALTPAGHVYVDYCHQILTTIEEADRAVEVLKGGMQGQIKLSVPVSFGQVFMSHIISEFQQKYPDIQVQLELQNTIKDLKVDQVDLAIRMSNQLDDDLVAIKIGELQMRIYGAKGYLAEYDRVTLETLKQHKAILHSQVDKHQSWPLMIDNDVSHIALNWSMSVNHYGLIYDAVIAGKGLARLPTYLVNTHLSKPSKSTSREVLQSNSETKQADQEAHLQEVLSDYVVTPDPIYLVYDYQGVLPMKNRVFIDFVKAWFADNPC